MITTHNYLWIEDISSPNNIFFIEGKMDSIHLSAAVYTFKTVRWSVAITKKEGLLLILSKIRAVDNKWDNWLLLTTRAVQPDTKIVRHIGFWGQLKGSGIKFNSNQYAEFSTIPYPDGMKFFGAIAWDDNQLDLVVRLTMEQQAAIVILEKDTALPTINRILQNGKKSLPFEGPNEIIQTVCIENGVVFYILGQFDDPDVEIIIIGKKEILREMSLIN